MREHEYNLLAQSALVIERTFRSMIDEPEHILAKQLHGEIGKLLGFFRANKLPRSLDEQIARVQRLLVRARDIDDGIMRIDENLELYRQLDRLRTGIRKLPNYQ